MTTIQSILIGLGANHPGFDQGIITGGTIVLIVLICVFIVSRIIEGAKQSKGK